MYTVSDPNFLNFGIIMEMSTCKWLCFHKTDNCQSLKAKSTTGYTGFHGVKSLLWVKPGYHKRDVFHHRYSVGTEENPDWATGRLGDWATGRLGKSVKPKVNL